MHKDLQDTIAQLEAIRHEIRTISFMNPGPMTRKYLDNIDQTSPTNGIHSAEILGLGLEFIVICRNPISYLSFGIQRKQRLKQQV